MAWRISSEKKYNTMIGTSPQLLKMLFTFQRRENNYYVIKQVKLLKKKKRFWGKKDIYFQINEQKVNISVQLQEIFQQ